MQGSLNRILSVILFLFFIMICGRSLAQKSHYVIFYNVENLFDYFDDPLTNDEAFTPLGDYHWTKEKFNTKIRMIYKAIVAGCEGNFPDIIGLAEVENRWVLEQLISKTPLKEVPYGIIHKESPDIRGIDVSLLFRKDRVIPVDINFLAVSDSGKRAFLSRDILYFKGKIEGAAINFYINHWPSRSEGYVESKGKRALAAKVLKTNIDSLRKKVINSRILIMGDFNATPKEDCLQKILKASLHSNRDENYFLTNLSATWLKHREGTICRAGQWDVFDQFICSQNLITGDTVTIKPSDTRICFLPFLLEKDKNHLGTKPFRTYLGPAYHGGISDHLPIATIIKGN
jgi:hypothetical protein